MPRVARLGEQLVNVYSLAVSQRRQIFMVVLGGINPILNTLLIKILQFAGELVNDRFNDWGHNAHKLGARG